MLEVLACVDYSTSENFTRLAELVNKHSHETSGFILVLMQWDARRKHLVRELRAANIPLLVITVSESGKPVPAEDDPMADRPDLFWILQAGRIQESLDRQQIHTYAGIR